METSVHFSVGGEAKCDALVTHGVALLEKRVGGIQVRLKSCIVVACTLGCATIIFDFGPDLLDLRKCAANLHELFDVQVAFHPFRQQPMLAAIHFLV